MGEYEYFYPDGADQYAFYRIPKRLFTDADLKLMTNGSKILYGLLLDRVDLSVKNRWLDDRGRVYIIYTLDQIQESMNVTDKPATKMLQELERNGLVERYKQGQGKPDRLFVKNFSRPENIRFQNRSFSESRIGNIPIAGSENLRCINTDKNNTDNNQTNLILSAEDEIRRRRQVEQFFMEKLQYQELLKEFPHERETLEGILSMVTDLCSSKQQYVRITGDDKPAAVVRSQMMKLTGDHIRYVLQGLHQGTSEIRNMKQYLVSCLYNAPLTIDPYYTAMVNHDMASTEPAAKDRYAYTEEVSL